MKDVTIFTTPSCHYCKDVKKYFDDNKIVYSTIDVASDMTARKNMIEISGQMGVPVIMIDKDVIVGFNKSKLAELLDIK